MLATAWLDVIFILTYAAGIEEIEDVPGTDGGYGNVIIHADWTHSLVGSAVIAAVTGWIATRWWGRRGGVVIGAVVFSHWILDLVVHRDDLAILPGNAGDLTVGFGLWNVEWASSSSRPRSSSEEHFCTGAPRWTSSGQPVSSVGAQTS